ncbi:hypothetical protein N431DRAFT_365287 [Stipitochalara longipes BDJ]|nr:hypothetical protein N431DRAFT_365287 [Stipitochalara longipes BDJ]
MAGADTNIAAAALAIALVALCTTVGQLLQQYFATADGYRRCQKSVMGEYACKTRLQWRWREFRFETLYTTPEIFLAGDGAPNRVGQVLLTGSEKSRELSFVPASSMDNDEEVILERPTAEQYNRGMTPTFSNKHPGTYRAEMVCWVSFLHWIHEKTSMCLDHQPNVDDPVHIAPPFIRLPGIIFRERSWDFQPPDVVRPLAKTTLSDIAVIARRMGMKWKDFRPSDGILRAEGHSQTITSTVVRSLGLVLQYSYTGQNQRLAMAEHNLRKRLGTGSILAEQEEIYIPTAEADRLGCGVLRTDRRLGLPDVTVSTQTEIITALSYLDRSGTSPVSLTKILREYPEFRFRVGDIVALTTRAARLPGSHLVQVPAPSDNMQGVTTSSVGRRAFRQCLEEYLVVHKGEVGIHTQHALDICYEIGTKYAAWDHADDYSAQDEQWIVTRDAQYLDVVQERLDSLNDLLHGWEQAHSFRYHNLLGIHIRIAMFAEGGDTSMPQNLATDYKADVDGYFRQLPKIVEEMKKTGFHDQQMIVDAWVTMILRAMCWGACHFFVPGERVPIQYFGSQLPVYIG